MAHFAKLDNNNKVLSVHVLDNSLCINELGAEEEQIGVNNLIKIHGWPNWKKCSYNTYSGVHIKGGTPFRKNYPGIGFYYSPEHDFFYPEKPYANCETLNLETGLWNLPSNYPTILTYTKTFTNVDGSTSTEEVPHSPSWDEQNQRWICNKSNMIWNSQTQQWTSL
jgi:hypothetical protein